MDGRLAAFITATLIIGFLRLATSCDVTSYSTVTKANLPLVDMKEPGVPIKLVSALEDWGFAYIKNHEVPGEVTENAYRQNQNFFNLPHRTKRQLQANRFQATKTARGYTPLLFEQLDGSVGGRPDIKEVFDVGYTDPRAGSNARHYLGQNYWPRLFAGKGRNRRDLGDEMKQEVDGYAAEMANLGKSLLSSIFTGIGCSEAELDDNFGPNALQVLRLTRYPSLDEYLRKDPAQIGAGPHSDYGGITLLSARGPGLVVLKPNRTSGKLYTGTFSDELGVPNSGDWVNVPALPGKFIVMAGEALQRLTNGQIFAIKHKVELSQTKPRNSLAYFYDPKPDAVLKPLACAVKNGQSHYEQKLAGHKGVIRDPFLVKV